MEYRSVIKSTVMNEAVKTAILPNINKLAKVFIVGKYQK